MHVGGVLTNGEEPAVVRVRLRQPDVEEHRIVLRVRHGTVASSLQNEAELSTVEMLSVSAGTRAGCTGVNPGTDSRTASVSESQLRLRPDGAALDDGNSQVATATAINMTRSRVIAIRNGRLVGPGREMAHQPVPAAPFLYPLILVKLARTAVCQVVIPQSAGALHTA